MAQNQPAIPTERRSEDRGKLLTRLYNQPVDDQVDNAIASDQLRTDGNVLYDCNFCNASFARVHNLKEHQNRKHLFISFFCWLCHRNLKMTYKSKKDHFIIHENHASRDTGYVKIQGNSLFNIYKRSFYDEDYWPYNPFADENLDDLIKMIRINASIKDRIIVKLICKMWFEPKAGLNDETPKFVWMTLKPIQVDLNEIQLKQKIKTLGEDFINTFLEQESVENSGSGYTYYAISDITLKCFKNMQFGCHIESPKQQKLIEKLSTKKILYNPPAPFYCFQQCIQEHQSSIGLILDSDQKILETINKSTISFLDLDNLPFDFLSFGVRIFYLNELENDKFTVQCIFTSNQFHLKHKQINLLAICSEHTDAAHFVLIRNILLLIRHIEKDGNKLFFCQFCFQKKTKHRKVIELHELFCLSNPQKNRQKRQKSENLSNFLKTIKFSSDKEYLKCNNKGRSAPNFYGFLDFETVFSTINDCYASIKVCNKHRFEGKSNCKCPQTIKSDKIESLSYSLILIDFNLNQVIYEKYYVQKTENDDKAGEHLASVLLRLSYAISLINSIEYPINMSLEQKRLHKLATHCEQCKKKFSQTPTARRSILNLPFTDLESCKIPCAQSINNEKYHSKRISDSNMVHKGMTKTAHHLHHVKEHNFIGSLCSKCNLSVQSRYQSVPIFCHNFSRFDHVFILKGICRLWKQTKLTTLSKSENNIMLIRAKPFDLKDSLNFLSGSLDDNVELVKKSCEKHCILCSAQNQCADCKQATEFNLKSTFSLIYNSDLSKEDGKFSFKRFKDNLKKSAFPYQLLTKYEDLVSMTSFPDYDSFYSILKGKNVDIKEYNAAKLYFNSYCSNMADFLKTYNTLDTYLLCAVWRVMADILKEKLDYHPENFNSLPAVSLEVATSLLCPNPDFDQNTCIELFDEKNRDIYIKCQENIRGGIVLVNSKFEIDGRFKEIFLNNKIKNKEELIYLDATNLYGYCLSDILPCGNYQHVSNSFIKTLNKVVTETKNEQKMMLLDTLLPDDCENGYAFDIRIVEIPEFMHEFPPFYGRRPVKADDISPADFYNYMMINDVDYAGRENPTLIPLLNENDETFTHYRLIKEALRWGAKLEFLSGVRFKQKYLFKDYISLLAKLRVETNNPAHARLFKLLANALYGKLLQSIFKYRKIRDFFFLDECGFIKIRY